MSFDNISIEVLSLYAVLKECEETLFDRPLQPTREERLIVTKDGCHKVLVDLQSLVERYESLGTQSKRTWDRMKWGNEDIDEIRARLVSSTTMLNTFISTSQSNIESKLDKFIEEYRQGRREASVISLQTVDSLSGDDKTLWRTIRKDLEEIGISVAAFDANRTFIFDWFTRAAETGAFAEQGQPGIDDENDHSEEQASRSNNELVKEDAGQETRHTQYETFTDIREDRPFARPHSLIATTVAEPHSPERGPKTSGEIVASPSVFIRDSTRVPRIAAFLAVVTRPRRRLLRAVEEGDSPRALKILSDKASLKRLDSKSLGKSLWSATLLEDLGSSDQLSLISELIARGADVDYRSSGSFARTSLQNCVEKKSITAVRLLIENGANVNYYGSKLESLNDNNYEHDSFAPRLALTQDTEMLRLLLSAGADADALYKIPVKGHARSFVWINLLHEAALLGAIPAIEVFIEHGVDIDLLCPSYGTALMAALLEGTNDTAKFLLARGANPNTNIKPEYMEDFRTQNVRQYTIFLEDLYKTPIEAAIVGGKLSMVKLLLESGVLPSQSTLHFAKDVRYKNSSYFSYQRTLDDHHTWNDHPSWRLVSNNYKNRKDYQIIEVLEEALRHHND